MINLDGFLDQSSSGFQRPMSGNSSWTRLGTLLDPMAVLSLVHQESTFTLMGKTYESPHSDHLQMLANNGLKCHGIGCDSSHAFLSLEQHGPENTSIRGFVKKDNQEILLTIDHDVARSLGGTNTLDNYKPLCSICNSKKSNVEYRNSVIHNAWPHVKNSFPEKVVMAIDAFRTLLEKVSKKESMATSNLILFCNLKANEKTIDTTLSDLYKNLGSVYLFTESGFAYFIRKFSAIGDWVAHNRVFIRNPIQLIQKIDGFFKNKTNELPKTKIKKNPPVAPKLNSNIRLKSNVVVGKNVLILDELLNQEKTFTFKRDGGSWTRKGVINNPQALLSAIRKKQAFSLSQKTYDTPPGLLRVMAKSGMKCQAKHCSTRAPILVVEHQTQKQDFSIRCYAQKSNQEVEIKLHKNTYGEVIVCQDCFTFMVASNEHYLHTKMKWNSNRMKFSGSIRPVVDSFFQEMEAVMVEKQEGLGLYISNCNQSGFEGFDASKWESLFFGLGSHLGFDALGFFIHMENLPNSKKWIAKQAILKREQFKIE